MLTYGIPPGFRGGIHMKPPYAIGSVPSLWGHAVAYRWRSLPRVRRHRASKPQGSSEWVLPWQITMDQLIFASLSHTHYWYEVGMLKVPAVLYCCRNSWGGDCDVMILAAALAIFWPTRVSGVCLCRRVLPAETGENSICLGFNLRVPPRVGANRHVCITAFCLRY